MGANEKHEATYHGAEYTPDTTRVRHGYVDHVDYSAQLHGLPSNDKGAGEAFDRWLETVRAEAKAEALRELAEEIGGAADNFIARAETIDGLAVTRFNAYATAYRSIGRYLLARANQYKENQS